MTGSDQQINKLKALAWLVQFSLLITFLVYRQLTSPLGLNSDISSIFSTDQVDQLSTITAQIEQQALRSQIVLVGSENLADAIVGADQLAAQLKQTAGVARVNVIFEQLPTLAGIIDQNISAKHLLLTEQFRSLLIANDRERFFSFQFSLLNQMGDPTVALSIERDPSLSIADYFSRPLVASSGLSPVDNRLVAHHNNKHYVFVSFTTATSGIDIAASQALVASINLLGQQSALEYLYTGAIFYASEASATGQFEMTLYGGLSLLAMLLMIALVYRNAIAMVLTLTLIGISFVYGYLALSFFYSEISIIALVFSVTLIGISADYSFHALTELKHGKYRLSQPLAGIYSSLIMSYLTTGAGYLILMMAPFVLFKQIAIFTIFGLFGALITVLLLFGLMANNIKRSGVVIPGFVTTINRGHQRFTLAFSLRKYLALPLILLVLVTAYVSDFNDDVREFYAVSEVIQTNENKVKKILGQKWDLQYILLEGHSLQAVLVREEAISTELAQLKQQGALSSYRAISQWLPSNNRQAENLVLFEQAYNNGWFEQLNQLLGLNHWPVNSPENILTPHAWFATPIGKMFAGQWIQDQGKHYSVIRIAGISDLAAINAKISPLADVYFIDKASDISAQVSQFRTLLIYILGAAVLAALVVFCSRYGWAVATRAIISPVAALIIALCLSALIQQQLNIFNLVAGVLILALGLDYSVFFAEHGFEQKITLTTLMSGLSSIFVFAILIFSSMPAIQSFGLTVFLGVLVVFILAPQVIKVDQQRTVG